MRREYESGSKWAIWRWKDITWNGELYLRRLHIFQCPWFSILLHFIKTEDKQRHLHDHPVDMFCVVLKGAYCEDRGETREAGGYLWPKWRDVVFFNWIPAYRKHRITYLALREQCITLCFCGPRKREWGFHTEDGWIPWREYHAKYEGGTSGRN